MTLVQFVSTQTNFTVILLWFASSTAAINTLMLLQVAGADETLVALQTLAWLLLQVDTQVLF